MTGYLPYAIDVVGGRGVVRWIERGATSTNWPFFAQFLRERLESGAAQRVTPLDTLLTDQGPDPAGLVMHLSRCGSTLLMQSLAHAGCVSPISEAAPVNQLLARGDIPALERAGLLRGLIRALGPQGGESTALPSLVKFTSWNVLFMDVIRAAFAGTPWLFLYRQPLEAMASHQAHPAGWLTDGLFLASLAPPHPLRSLAGLDGEARCAAVLAAYGEAALGASPAPVNLLNYSQLPAALLADVPSRFGVQTSAVQQGQIAEASRIYSKDASRRLIFDADGERRSRCVTDRMREVDRQLTQPVHAELERRRLGAAGGGRDGEPRAW